MKWKRLRIFLVIIVTTILTAWVLENHDLIYSGPHVSNKIVYSCGDYTEVQLCIVNTDGTELMQITERRLDGRISRSGQEIIATGYVSPVMNDRGQILTLCYEAISALGEESDIAKSAEELGIDPHFIWLSHSFGICSVRFDGTDEKILKDPSIGGHVGPHFALNNRGSYWLDCFTSLCRESLTENNASGNYWEMDEYSAQFAVNRYSLLVFGCYYEELAEANFIASGTMQLCITDQSNPYHWIYLMERLINPQAHAPRQLTSNGYMNRNPIVNDNGKILFHCDSPEDAGICTMNSDGSGWTRASRNYGEMHWDINNNDIIVSECYDGNDTEICVYQEDLSEPVWLTDNDTMDEYPAINDQGVIAFVCDGELCIIHADGTGLRVLETDEQTKPMIFHVDEAGLRRAFLDIK